MTYTIAEIKDIIGAEVSQPLHDNQVAHLLTNSRELVSPRDTLFFAISTATGDGHRYIADLYGKGVRSFVVDNVAMLPEGVTDANVLVVDNSLHALQRLAGYHRSRFDIPVVAITGSRGKTVCKEWLYAMLKDRYRIVRSPGSYNSQVGVPLSLWEIDEKTSLAIIEAGISQAGEMERLEAIIRPTVGIFTCLTDEHAEGFASRREKAAEKAKLFARCKTVVAPVDDVDITMALTAAVNQDNTAICTWSAMPRAKGVDAMIVDCSELLGASVTVRYAGKLNTYRYNLQFELPEQVSLFVGTTLLAIKLGVKQERLEKVASSLTDVSVRTHLVEGYNYSCIFIDDLPNDLPSINRAMQMCKDQYVSVLALADLDEDGLPPETRYEKLREIIENYKTGNLILIGPQMKKYFPRQDRQQWETISFYDSVDDFEQRFDKSFLCPEIMFQVKGCRRMDMRRVADLLQARHHQTYETIDLAALVHNYKVFKARLNPSTRTLALVKADAYGTGSVNVARALVDAGIDYLAVAAIDEGSALVKAGITAPIIVLNPNVVDFDFMINDKLEPEVYNIEQATNLIAILKQRNDRHELNEPYPVHIKIDSGMHRLGFTREQLPRLFELFGNNPDLVEPRSVFTHLCVADEPEQDEYTLGQLDYFEQCAAMVREAFPKCHILRHALNTSGAVRFTERQMEMVRLGIGLYGIKTVFDGSEDLLWPVAALYSVIISIKEWPAGTTIGYGRKGVLSRPSRIATVTIGYADGYDRHYGNGRAHMWVGGTLCPTVGNVCMDAVMIDITDAPATIKVGDEVEVFGGHVPIEDLAAARDTIPYEVLTSVAPRVRRIYVNE